MFDKNLSQILSTALAQLHISTDKTEDLLAFIDLLNKWNKAYNLTAIRDLEQMVILHIIDSASVYNFLSGNSIIDVGTGGGIPGIIFAILNPSLKVTLLDASQKKTRFLRFAKRQLKLDNIAVVCARVEKFQPEKPESGYDVVISRAFSDVDYFLQVVNHLCAPNGKIYAMKGPRKESNEQAIGLGFELEKDISVHVPFLDASRRLLIFGRNNAKKT